MTCAAPPIRQKHGKYINYIVERSYNMVQTSMILFPFYVQHATNNPRDGCHAQSDPGHYSTVYARGSLKSLSHKLLAV